jgi:ADP-ribosyl-[dinitrogen reductase] hydrolase
MQNHPDWHHSSSLEKLLEYRFLADLTTVLWRRGERTIEILRAEVDNSGYDVAIEVSSILRHVQLKARRQGGKRNKVGINIRLAQKPSGCVVWMDYHPETLELGPFLWFGSAPGKPLPPLGDKAGRHTKGDKDGIKAARPGIREVPRSRFQRFDTIEQLANALFGPGRGSLRMEADTEFMNNDDGVSLGGMPPLLAEPERRRLGACIDGLARQEADRAYGVLLGLAVGDALGTTLEFSQRDSLPFHREMTGGGPFGLAPGQWTDDTAMALALADSLLTCGDFDAVDLMGRFVRWWQEGVYSCTGECFDIGTTTRAALERFIRTGNPYAGSDDVHTAGNGSLMRLAPVALFAFGDRVRALDLARAQSRTTHGAPQAVEACAFFCELLQDAITEGKDVLDRRPWDGHAAIKAIASGEWRDWSRDRIRSSGYVVATLEAALWCVAQTNTFEDALVLAVNLGDDADTVGAVTGQLAGAVYGASAIPERWLKPLAWREHIEETASLLYAAGTRR